MGKIKTGTKKTVGLFLMPFVKTFNQAIFRPQKSLIGAAKEAREHFAREIGGVQESEEKSEAEKKEAFATFQENINVTDSGIPKAILLLDIQAAFFGVLALGGVVLAGYGLSRGVTYFASSIFLFLVAIAVTAFALWQRSILKEREVCGFFKWISRGFG